MSAAVTRHPPVESLHAYGLGTLAADDHGAVDRHLSECPTCRAAVDETPADDFLRRLRESQRGDETPAPARPLSPLAEWSVSVNAGTLSGVAPAPIPVTDLSGLADYTVLSTLGRGGMGAVYLARNTLTGRTEALKVIRPDVLTRPEVVDRFLREVRAAVALGHHPHVVTTYTAFRHGETVVLSMEPVDGRDLSATVRDGGPLPVRLAAEYARQAALGLQHAHERGVVHRDVKPHNLLLANGTVKVSDFGLAKLRDGPDAELTGFGAIMGTPDYVAPEQCRDAAGADGRADVYGLGCTLYFLLAGHPPFPDGDAAGKLFRHAFEPPTPIRELRPEVEPGLADVLAKMLAKTPAARYQSAAEAAAALEPFTRDPAPPAPPRARPTNRRPVRIAAAVVGVAAILAVAAWAGGLLRVKTAHGTIVLDNIPPDAVVEVDGKTATVTRNGNKVTVEALPAGPHKLQVTADGAVLKLSNAEVDVGGQPVQVRVEEGPPVPPAAPPAVPPATPPAAAPPAAAPAAAPADDPFAVGARWVGKHSYNPTFEATWAPAGFVVTVRDGKKFRAVIDEYEGDSSWEVEGVAEAGKVRCTYVKNVKEKYPTNRVMNHATATGTYTAEALDIDFHDPVEGTRAEIRLKKPE